MEQEGGMGRTRDWGQAAGICILHLLFTIHETFTVFLLKFKVVSYLSNEHNY